VYGMPTLRTGRADGGSRATFCRNLERERSGAEGVALHLRMWRSCTSGKDPICFPEKLRNTDLAEPRRSSLSFFPELKTFSFSLPLDDARPCGSALTQRVLTWERLAEGVSACRSHETHASDRRADASIRRCPAAARVQISKRRPSTQGFPASRF
jgi:hypothetical protein